MGRSRCVSTFVVNKHHYHCTLTQDPDLARTLAIYEFPPARVHRPDGFQEAPVPAGDDTRRVARKIG
jgi:hypothetical protein